MGYLVYNSERLDLQIEDRTLAHLQIVIINKLRKNESFAFSWMDSRESGDGRSTIWVTPASGLHFKFAGSRMPEISAAWLQVLYEAAGSGRGLYVVDEPSDSVDVTIDADATTPVGLPERPLGTATRAARPAGS
ncbi:hypothetical protein EDF46_0990 [Frondihabitans sp. PhB188]|uniref:DUF7882 family protein n=1 Tax=Frondihabitans sp. PhB188 TaxID=2485200 RepID=UPI000FA0F182|nr:ATP-dependent DNA ligase [Frondihabitans sp. PhB188]ROQ41608.1 hypothetical protein EDF46_0990 [Frondihabitans sp. PhB188]